MSDKKNPYKEKFLVPGETIQNCTSLGCCGRTNAKYSYLNGYADMPPCIKDVAIRLHRTYNLFNHLREMNKCPYKEKLGKPNDYVVSHKHNGTWSCSCKGWIFKWRKLGVDCEHIKEAKARPEKYRMAVENTGKTANIFKELLG